MNRRWLIALLGLLPALPFAQPLPAEHFFARPVIGNAVLSPSGTRLAFTQRAAGQRSALVVLDLQTLQPKTVAQVNDADVVAPRWLNDERLAFSGADFDRALADRRGLPYLMAVNHDGSNYRRLEQRRWVWPIGTQGPLQEPVIHVAQWEAMDFATLLRLHTTSRREDVIEAPLNANQWLLDERGELRAVRTSRHDKSALHWRDPASGTWKQLREFDRFTGIELSLLAALDDGRLLVGAGHRGWQALWHYDPATDRLADKPLLAVAQYDVAPHELIQRDGRLLGVRFIADAEVTVWLDEGMKALQARIDALLPATANLLTPARRGNSPWVLVRSFSDQQPELFHLFNTATAKLLRVGAARPDVQPGQMATMDLVRLKARDGLEIPAYLTLPPNAKKPLPMVLLVHGGPWVRGQVWRWDDEVQFLASRGYAVLQPEFRGSLGFGHAHFRASFKQWGQAMQDDLADAARWAVAQGIADPRRICIAGASYGGYAALMGLVKDGELFACGISWAGVSDILLLHDATWSDLSDEWKRYGMSQMVGDRVKDEAMLVAHSPVQQAARIQRPLLLGHGRIDRRVPIEHGQRLRDAVQAHNRHLEWVLYDKEGHGWSLPETQVDWWTRVERFLGKHIGGTP